MGALDVHHSPVEVTAVAHDDTHTVDVALAEVEWRQIIGDIARRIFLIASADGAPMIPLIYAAGRPENDVDRTDALTKLVHRLGMSAPTFSMDPMLAFELGVELFEAAAEPTSCRCGRFVNKPSELTDTCGTCTDRADTLRVVGA